MRKVVLRMNKQFKYDIIKKLVDDNGNKKRVAQKLNCSVRTINHLIASYKKFGKTAFIHGNRNRKPSYAFNDQTKALVIDLYRTKYSDANIKHFSKLLLRYENISVSDSTIRSWLFDHAILSPKATRKTKKRLKTKLKLQKSNSTTIKNKRKIDDKLESLDRQDAHPRRPDLLILVN